jgi:hypothetical protein
MARGGHQADVAQSARASDKQRKVGFDGVADGFAHDGRHRRAGELGRREPEAFAVGPPQEAADIDFELKLEMREAVADKARLALPCAAERGFGNGVGMRRERCIPGA